MALREIVKLGDDILHKKCRVVEKFDDKLAQLLDDMYETLLVAEGVGLAAPQVGILKRVCIVLMPDEEEPIELINPTIVKREGEQHEIEGCLSCPGEWGITDRPYSVEVEAFDRNGKKFKVSGEELKARALCHEIDHLDGILFIDHAEMLTQEELEEMQHVIED